MRVLLVAVILSSAWPVHAGAQGGPDLSGVWVRATDKTDQLKSRFRMEDAPLQPWALEKYRAHRKGTKQSADEGREDLDPAFHCFPAGVPRVMLLNLNTPIEIVQTPGRMFILFERHPLARRIYTDGRAFPDGFPDSFMGYSVGRWQGDTLIVETQALNDKTWIDEVGTPHSDALKVIERFRRLDRETLEVDFLFEDAKAFTKPWGGKKTYRLAPDMEVLEYVPCEERMQIGRFLR